jgi:hypothetical protein
MNPMGGMGMGQGGMSGMMATQQKVMSEMMGGMSSMMAAQQKAMSEMMGGMGGIGAGMGMGMSGMSGMWNPNAICDGTRAEERAIWLQQNQGLRPEAARQKVMSEFPQQFGGSGAGMGMGMRMGGMWNPNAICDGTRAEELAIWLQQNQGLSHEAARQKVMSEFPQQFGGGGGYGKMYNPNAFCDGCRAEERVLWLQQNERMNVEMARERVMREFPGSF